LIEFECDHVVVG